MTTRREQYLDALGIDLWKARAAVSLSITSAVPVASIVPAPAVAPVPVVLPATVVAPAPALAGLGTAAASIGSGGTDHDAEVLWGTLEQDVAACTLCALAQTRTRTVFGVGPHRCELLVIGEAPGAEEDRQGEPFVGRAGLLLNSMLRAMGNPREAVFIANVLKCRPPANRDPKPDEVACCLPYLQRQIDLLRPRLMLAVGRIAAQNLLATDTPIGKLRGTVHRFGSNGTPLIVTYHPAYLLRSPLEKRRAWIDLKFARAELASLRVAGQSPAPPGTSACP